MLRLTSGIQEVISVNNLQLVQELIRQRDNGISGSIYWKTQIEFAYNSNKIEGGRLTRGQTRHIFDTGSVDGIAPVNDIIETRNHFKLFDYMLDTVDEGTTIGRIKAFHRILKNGVVDASSPDLGGWKTMPNSVGNITTTSPKAVQAEMERLLFTYQNYLDHKNVIGLEQILAFHHGYESIHPFFDGNGRTGRMIMFSQCLEHDIAPFIITDENKLAYIIGLEEWTQDSTGLLSVCKKEQGCYLSDVKEFLGK
jgi:Fic family protein